uniref:Uncharacterized protein n=1 Tax=Chromera velia CCMP2878 TaxID=1169474 RepID=A0A0G4I144_9ALVE|eukprot:Cvel_33.t1-p1 / transcript=Cvel_33.t1 / gene=Cvel_33 / organism=Chromera_velia_CCMP2878 / gene_product=hypothetical protein / transcript_product=hypothetical protein / location=Cvel_scaffold5:185387-187102(+) / protein_length=260 / sequence_SO=supercontig / SO=protein_coding / is_pseudo=false
MSCCDCSKLCDSVKSLCTKVWEQIKPMLPNFKENAADWKPLCCGFVIGGSFSAAMLCIALAMMTYMLSPVFVKQLTPFDPNTDIECILEIEIPNAKEVCEYGQSHSKPDCPVVCEEGYQLQENTLNCTQQGVFKGNATCGDVLCPSLDYIPGAYTVCPDGGKSGSSPGCEIVCADGAPPTDNTLKCTTDGVFIGSAQCPGFPEFNAEQSRTQQAQAAAATAGATGYGQYGQQQYSPYQYTPYQYSQYPYGQAAAAAIYTE